MFTQVARIGGKTVGDYPQSVTTSAVGHALGPEKRHAQPVGGRSSTSVRESPQSCRNRALRRDRTRRHEGAGTRRRATAPGRRSERVAGVNRFDAHRRPTAAHSSHTVPNQLGLTNRVFRRRHAPRGLIRSGIGSGRVRDSIGGSSRCWEPGGAGQRLALPATRCPVRCSLSPRRGDGL